MPDIGVEGAASGRRLGVLVVGLGGAVASTAAAGIEMLKAGSNDHTGLPLANSAARGLAAYRNMEFAGWDLHGVNLAAAVEEHRVLDREQGEMINERLSQMSPWPAVGSTDFCRNVDGTNKVTAKGHRAAVEQIRADIRRYRETSGAEGVVVMNLASVERWPEDTRRWRAWPPSSRGWTAATRASARPCSTPTRRCRRACPTATSRRAWRPTSRR